MSIVIGSPTRGNRRNPNRTVLTHRAPSAVLVEFVGADHVGGNILVGAGVIFAVIAHAAPVIETIEAGCAGHLILHGSAAGEGGLVSGFDFHSGTLAVGLALSAKYRDGGSVGVGINVKTIVAGLEDREGLIGRVDFVSLAAE